MVCRRPAAAPWWYCCRRIQQNRDRLFAGIVEPINTYAVVGVGVFRDLEHIGRSVVVKFHGQRIRREDVVGDVTAPLSGDVFMDASQEVGTTRTPCSRIEATAFLCPRDCRVD